VQKKLKIQQNKTFMQLNKVQEKESQISIRLILFENKKIYELIG